jgi:hypothetical protein
MRLSELTFDPDTKETYWQVDDHGMVIVLGDNKSWMDSIGETFDALICYEEPELLEDGSVTAFRHPAHHTNDMSRDHVIYILLALRLFDKNNLGKVAEGLQYRISDKAKFSVDMWLWMKSLTGSKKYRRLYYSVAIPLMVVTVLWNKLLYLIGNFKPESNHATYKFTPNHEKPKIQNQLRSLIFL